MKYSFYLSAKKGQHSLRSVKTNYFVYTPTFATGVIKEISSKTASVTVGAFIFFSAFAEVLLFHFKEISLSSVMLG